MKTSEILSRAAEIMIERGHVKEELDLGGVCLFGACIAARKETGTDLGIAYWERPEGAYLQQVTGATVVENWNDHPETTEAMALGALHEAAILAKEQGD